MNAPHSPASSTLALTRARTAVGLELCICGLALLSLMVGSQGWEPLGLGFASSGGIDASVAAHTAILWDIRLPRTLGVVALGLLLGLGGALAVGGCRYPLADPDLWGAGAGAAFAVTLVAAARAG
ncbi:MAG: iron chelate uptake ABC transporter family permease subunit, partial [Betaproteobacteria bacterium]